LNTALEPGRDEDRYAALITGLCSRSTGGTARRPDEGVQDDSGSPVGESGPGHNGGSPDPDDVACDPIDGMGDRTLPGEDPPDLHPEPRDEPRDDVVLAIQGLDSVDGIDDVPEVHGGECRDDLIRLIKLPRQDEATTRKWYEELRNVPPLSERGGGVGAFASFIQTPANMFLELGVNGLLVFEGIPSGVAAVHIYLWDVESSSPWATAFQDPTWFQATLAWAFAEFECLRKFIVVCSEAGIKRRLERAGFTCEGTLRDEPAGAESWYMGLLRKEMEQCLLATAAVQRALEVSQASLLEHEALRSRLGAPSKA